MRSNTRELCAAAFVGVGILLQSMPGDGQTSRRADSTWERVYIDDVHVRDAVSQALRRASERLDAPKCQSLLLEFLDGQERPLNEKLKALSVTVQDYLHLLIFKDGETLPQCTTEGVLGFTEPGSRIVYLCGATFERHWRRNPQEASATLIHELLHSLGLGENPPSPRQITDRVQRFCW